MFVGFVSALQSGQRHPSVASQTESLLQTIFVAPQLEVLFVTSRAVQHLSAFVEPAMYVVLDGQRVGVPQSFCVLTQLFVCSQKYGLSAGQNHSHFALEVH